MTTPISQDVGVRSSGYRFMSFDEKVCRVICEGLKEDFLNFFKKGLPTDYCLQTEVCLNKLVFPKGSSLVFIIIHCCTKASFHWELIEMLRLLLNKQMQTQQNIEHGGGYANVLKYACEQASALSSEMLFMLFECLPIQELRYFLNQIQDPIKKIEIEQRLSLTSLASSSTQITYLETLTINETELCRSLLSGDINALCNFFEDKKGKISPNYVLKNSVSIDKSVCNEGESLLMIVLRACVETQCCMKVVESLAFLIENNVNLEQRSSGTHPLHYVCKNEPLFSESVITCLLTSVTPSIAFNALEQVSNPQKRVKFQNILSSETYPFQFEKTERSLQEECYTQKASLTISRHITFEETSYVLFSENEDKMLCRALLEGNIEYLVSVFEDKKGKINPNYVLKNSVTIDRFVFKKKTSLLMVVLRAYVTNLSLKVVESLSLLIEHKVSWEQPSLGILPLHYLCENERAFSQDVIICLLNFVSLQTAVTAVEHIVDPIRRALFKDILNGKICPLQCAEEDLVSFYETASSTKESLLLPSENIISKPVVSTEKETSETSSATTPLVIYCSEQAAKRSPQTSPTLPEPKNFHNLLLQISNNNFTSLEKILSNPECLSKYETYFQTNFQETFIYFLFNAIKEKGLLYNICLCLFKHGVSPDILITQSKTLFQFLFSIREKIPKKELSINAYLQILCLTVFFTERSVDMREVEFLMQNIQDTLRFKACFHEDKITSGLQPVCLENVVHNYRYYPFLLAFLDTSLIKNKDVITQKTWNIDTYLLILTALMKTLCKTKFFESADVIKVKQLLLETFASVLVSGFHKNNFQEKHRCLFVSWLQRKTWIFQNSSIEEETWKLIQTYWSSILKPNYHKEKFQRTTKFRSNLHYYFISYFIVLQNFFSTISDYLPLNPTTVRNQFDIFLSSHSNPITKKTWNVQDLCCLFSTVIQELEDLMNPTKHLTVYEKNRLFILQNLPETFFLVSQRTDFYDPYMKEAYEFLQKEINIGNLPSATRTQLRSLLNTYWGRYKSSSQETTGTGKRKRDED